jgi:hypothetical protein
MNVGMLWFDGDRRRELSARIAGAAEFYRRKYGGAPNVCFVNPKAADGNLPGEVSGLRVRASRAVLQDHFWIGVEDLPGE